MSCTNRKDSCHGNRVQMKPLGNHSLELYIMEIGNEGGEKSE